MMAYLYDDATVLVFNLKTTTKVINVGLQQRQQLLMHNDLYAVS